MKAVRAILQLTLLFHICVGGVVKMPFRAESCLVVDATSLEANLGTDLDTEDTLITHKNKKF